MSFCLVSFDEKLIVVSYLERENGNSELFIDTCSYSLFIKKMEIVQKKILFQ